MSRQHLYQTIIQVDKTIVLLRNLQQEVCMTTFLLLPPSGYSIQGTENCWEFYSIAYKLDHVDFRVLTHTILSVMLTISIYNYSFMY